MTDSSPSAILEVDIGNTRTKWRMGDVCGASAGIDTPALPVAPERIRIACVAGDRAEVAERFLTAYRVTPEFAETSPELAGVRCGYAEPARLGVDRWLACVAAWHEVGGAVAVVDLGTAATLDFVAGNGRHLGGFIVPGLGLMATALARDTAGVRVAADLAPGLEPGRNTAQAVRRGTMAMLVDFIDASVARFARECGGAATVVLTGGDAELVADRLACAPRVEPDLVLDGLALALP